jgi:uncharacterized protein YecT (DUF1311 family)
MRPVRLPLLMAALAAVLLSACSKAPDPEVATLQTPAGAVPGPAEPEPAPAGPFAPPAFDCAQAQGDVQTLVCGDQRLAELDREIGRLAGLAAADPGLDQARRDELATGQADWTERRDDCDSSDDVRACALRESVLRIFQLRQAHAAARSDDGAGISRGPSAWKCLGFDPMLSSVYVNGEPASMALAWLDQTVALEATPDPDGLRYDGKIAEGDVAFVVKGSAAMFVRPGQPGLSCEIEPAG